MLFFPYWENLDFAWLVCLTFFAAISLLFSHSAVMSLSNELTLSRNSVHQAWIYVIAGIRPGIQFRQQQCRAAGSDDEAWPLLGFRPNGAESFMQWWQMTAPAYIRPVVLRCLPQPTHVQAGADRQFRHSWCVLRGNWFVILSVFVFLNCIFYQNKISTTQW